MGMIKWKEKRKIPDEMLHKYQMFFILLALEIIMAYSALGYIDIKPISVTFLTLPVVLGAFILGPVGGGALGAVFGLSSMWKAHVCAISNGDMVFSMFRSGKPLESFILSTVTRILFGVIAGLMFRFMQKHSICKTFHVWIVSILSFGVHTILVYFSMYLFFPSVIKEALKFSKLSLFLAAIFTYIIPATIIVILYKKLSKSSIRTMIVSISSVSTDRLRQSGQKRKILISLLSLIGVTLLLFSHVFARTEMVFRVNGMPMNQGARNGMLQVYIQLLISILALFYLIYIMLLYLFTYSSARKEEILKLNWTLEENERYKKTLEKIVDEAKTASEAKSKFISRMSHDLRTPLNAVIGLSAIGLDDTPVDSNEHDSFKKIWKSGNYLLGLVNNILDLSKIESDKTELNKRKFSISDCIGDIYTILKEQMQEKDLQFTYKTKGDKNYKLLVDGMRFQQIFMNLISNSVKYTPEGGCIEVETIFHELSEDSVRVICYVRDNGIGMDKEFMKVMYEPFKQGNNQKENHGCGLGLTIVKNLVELMDGEINVESEVNIGTEYRIEFKFEIAHIMAPREKLPEEEHSKLLDKRVLLVDDNMINVEIAKILLEKRGVIVEVAGNGRDAVEMFLSNEENYYNAILMDVLMPVLDGINATKQIRKCKRKYGKSIAIIAMTANAMEEDMKQAMENGMDAYLTKPIVPDHLYATLEEWVS